MSDVRAAIPQLLSLGWSKPVLNKPSVCKDIRDLHDLYVIAPVDKAVNNFVVVCKKFLCGGFIKRVRH